MYLLKGIGDVPVGQAECAMLALASKHGYEIPEALLEVRCDMLRIVFMNHYFFGLKRCQKEL